MNDSQMRRFFVVNHKQTVQPVDSDFWTNDSYEPVMFSESK